MARVTKKMLQEQIERLEENIKILITNPNSAEASKIKIKWQIHNVTPAEYTDMKLLFTKPPVKNKKFIWQQ